MMKISFKGAEDHTCIRLKGEWLKDPACIGRIFERSPGQWEIRVSVRTKNSKNGHGWAWHVLQEVHGEWFDNITDAKKWLKDNLWGLGLNIYVEGSCLG